MKKTKLAVAAAVAAVLAIVAVRVSAVSGARKAPAEAPAAPRVPAARVSRAAVDQRVTVTGSIRPRNGVELHADLAGRVEAVHANVGDRVRAGQVLAVVEHDELAWQAKAARAAVDIARANLDGARLEHARTKEMLDGGAAPKAQLDRVAVALALAGAQLAQAEAAAGLAEELVRNARVVAPFAGTITRRPVDVGAQVGPGTVVFVLEDVSLLELETAVEAGVWPRLARGARARVTIDAFPGEELEGRVTRLSPSLDVATRRAPVEIQLENAGGHLLSGAFARAELDLGRIEGALVVPREAVVDGPGGGVVWRVRDGKAEAVKPTFGASDARVVVVLGGLAEGDVVVTGGQGALSSGGAADVVVGERTAVR